jgi:pilus assembly protein Flp/PilA
MLTYFNVLNSIQELRRDIRGATAIEYALIAAGIALVIIASLTLVGDDLKALFAKVSTGLKAN